MKYGNVFTQMIMFSLIKVDDLRVRERENESERKKEPQIPHLGNVKSKWKITPNF